MKRIWSLCVVPFVLGLGCAAPEDSGEEAEPFSTEENDESTFADKADGLGKGYQPGCSMPTSPVMALGGTVLLPDQAVSGYVVIQDEKIKTVVRTRAEVPAGATIVDTGGVISPGFIDLHNHVAYNFIPLWNAGRRWNNRYQWARASGYDTAVKVPYNLTKPGLQCETVKYGEFRALVGGTTMIQGSVDSECTRSWVRNVEFTNFCEDHIRQNVLAIKGISQDDAASLNKQFQSGATKAFLVHLAEGIDDSSRAEFEQLRGLGLLKPQVVGIHSTALTEAQIKEMGQIGMKIVWSPLSNLILYGKTTNIPAALAANVKVALAPDWSPSGSANVLGELKVADRVNKELFGGVITDLALWRMAAQNPAEIVGMGDKLGKIAAGYFADLVVIKGDTTKPYRAFIDARPQDVALTMISGKAFYGDPAFLDTLGQKGKYVPVDACGTVRGLRAAEGDLMLPKNTQTVNDLVSAMQTAGVKNVIPLFQCDAAPAFAFQGISK